MEKACFPLLAFVCLACKGVQSGKVEETGDAGTLEPLQAPGGTWWNGTANAKLHALGLNFADPVGVNLFLLRENVHVAAFVHPNLYIVAAPPSAIQAWLLLPLVTSNFVWSGSVVIAQSMKDAVFGNMSRNSVCHDGSSVENRWAPELSLEEQARAEWVVDQNDRIVVEIVLPRVPGINLAACRLVLQQVLKNCTECVIEFASSQLDESLSLLVHLPNERGKLARWICSISVLPFVQWISPYMRVNPGNFGASLASSGSANYGLRELMGIDPFWGVGLSGNGQLIGIGDTGLDVSSCFFHDPEHPVPGLHHRKIIQYRSYADFSDGNGHGTHICGLLAGHSLDESMQQFDGIAPLARISFTDLGFDREDVFAPPEGLYNFFNVDYGLGARIHSDSWGADTPNYTVYSMDTDRFIWAHPDFVPVMAVGNTGDNVGSHSTMSSPASSKNSLTVGATLVGQSKHPVQAGDVIVMEVTGMKEAFGRGQFKILQSDMGPSFQSLVGLTWELLGTYPWNACNAYHGLEAARGKVLLVERGGCYNYEKVLAAQEYGAKGIVIYNNETSGSGFRKIGGYYDASLINIPAGSIPRSTARHIYRLLDKMEASTLQVRFLGVDFQYGPTHENIAEFSSFGPTTDGRIKPELVAPGDKILSASSNGEIGSHQCRVGPKTGTSMAAPLVAGCAALVRQYFVDGYHPSGIPLARNRFNPSGALVKAVLVNGAAEMKGLTEKGLPLEDPPSFRQGWGRIDMRNTLPVTKKFTLWVSDENSVQTNEEHFYCISVPQALPEPITPLKCTLAWYDAPANPSDVNKALINDLDLETFAPSGSPNWWRGAADIPDRLNNVERAIVDLPIPGSKYLVSVKGHFVPWPTALSKGQPYSLVVSGPLGTTIDPCTDCSGCPGTHN